MGKKVSDGKSVKVAVPASTVITKGNFYLLDGFLGTAVQSLETDGDGKVINLNGFEVPAGSVLAELAEVVLNIELGEYESSQIDVADAFAAGAKVYWDVANKRFTTVAADGVFCGIITEAKDANNVIWFWFAGVGHPDLKATAVVADLVAGNAQGAQAILNTGVVGNNNAITWSAAKVGVDGDDISVEMLDPAPAQNQALSVAVAGDKVTVNLATGAGTQASGTSGVEGNNNGITWTAAAGQIGTAGNDITVALEDPGAAGQALAVVVNGRTVIVNLATDGGGAITSTAAQVIAAVAAAPAAAALVAGANTGASTGAAAVTDEVVNLNNGVDPVASSTAAQVIAAVQGSAPATALVGVANTGASNGNGVVAAVAETNLAGGVNSEGQQALAKINELLASLRNAGLMAN